MRKIPIPLIAAAVFLSAVTIYITITIQTILSYDPTYVNFNGTNYIVTVSGSSPYDTFPPMYINVVNISQVYTVTSIGYGSSDTWYTCQASGCDIGLTIVNFPSMPNATALNPKSGVYVYKMNTGNVVLVYGTATTSGGTSGYIIWPYVLVATSGSEYFFILATQAQTPASTICSMSPFSTAGTAVIQARDAYYVCPTASWSSGTSSLVKTGYVSVGAGTSLGYKEIYSYSWGSIILHPWYYTTSSAYIVGKPN